jgi:hypothetical protein
MSWEDLDSEIGEMFHEYTWHTDGLEEAYERRKSWRNRNRKPRVAAINATSKAEYKAKWQVLNRDKVREHCKRWYEQNRQRAVEKTKAWRQANPDRAKATNRASYERRKAKIPKISAQLEREKIARYRARLEQRSQCELPLCP